VTVLRLKDEFPNNTVPNRSSNIIPFERKIAGTANGMHKGRSDAGGNPQGTKHAVNDEGGGVTATDLIMEYAKPLAIFSLTLLLIGAGVMWAGVHSQKSFVMEIGCIPGMCGFFFLIGIQFPHKKRFVAATLLALSIGTAIAVLGKYKQVDWLSISGFLLVIAGLATPCILLILRMSERQLKMLKTAVRVWGVGSAVVLAGMIATFFVLVKNFPTPQTTHTENRRAAATELYKVKHKEYEAGVDAVRRYDYEEAARHFNLAKKALSKKGPNSLDIARLNVCLGMVYLELGRLDEGYDLLNSAYVTLSKQKPDLPLMLARGLIMVYDIRSGEPGRLLLEAKDMLSQFDGEEAKSITEKANAAIAKNFVADLAAGAFMYINDFESAQYCQEIAMGSINMLDWPLRIVHYNNYGSILLFQNKYEEALAALKTGEGIVLKCKIPDNNDVASLYFNMAQTYCGLKDYPQAQEYADKAVSIRETLFGKDHPALISAYTMCVRIHSFNEDYAAAMRYAEAAERLSKKFWNDKHQDSAALYDHVGLMYKGMNDFPNAITYLNRSLDIMRALLLLDTSEGAQAYNDLGGVYMKMGDTDIAYEIYLKSAKIYAKIYGFDEQQEEEYKARLADWIADHIEADSPP